jgi:hypothetical protein
MRDMMHTASVLPPSLSWRQPALTPFLEEAVPLRVETHDLRAWRRLQSAVRSQVARAGLVIESNLTSNHQISVAQTSDQHPLWRFLFPDLGTGEDEQEVPLVVTVNTDNMLVFNTHLGQEFGQAVAHIHQHTMSMEHGLRAMERLAKRGVASRFTLPATTRRDVLEELLCMTLEGRTQLLGIARSGMPGRGR